MIGEASDLGGVAPGVERGRADAAERSGTASSSNPQPSPPADSDDSDDFHVELARAPSGSGLTEVEIFSLLAHNLRSVADKCQVLAWHPRRGHVYLAFIRECNEIEGCCRQAAAHREDARWLAIGMQISEARKRAGWWIRGLPSRDGRSAAHRLFLGLAEALKRMAYDCDRLRTMATGKLGLILPEIPEGPHRDTRPVSVLLPSLIIPGR